MMKNITLIIPAKDESESLPLVLKKLKKHDFKIMVVLHKSDLKTINSIKPFKVKIVFQNNLGYGDALIKGIIVKQNFSAYLTQMDHLKFLKSLK